MSIFVKMSLFVVVFASFEDEGCDGQDRPDAEEGDNLLDHPPHVQQAAVAATAPVPVPVEDQPAHGGDQPQVPGHVTDSGTAGLTSHLTSGLGRVKTVSIKNKKIKILKKYGRWNILYIVLSINIKEWKMVFLVFVVHCVWC